MTPAERLERIEAWLKYTGAWEMGEDEQATTRWLLRMARAAVAWETTRSRDVPMDALAEIDPQAYNLRRAVEGSDD